MCFKKFFQTAKLFITKPSEAFAKEQKTELGAVLKYALTGLLLFSPLAALISTIIVAKDAAIIPNPILRFIAIAVLTYFSFFVGLLVGSLWYHLWAYVFGARGGIEKTIRAWFYAATPQYAFGWIPVASQFTCAWSLILYGIGLKKYQKLTTGRVIGAILIPTIIIIIGTVIVFFAVVYDYYII